VDPIATAAAAPAVAPNPVISTLHKMHVLIIIVPFPEFLVNLMVMYINNEYPMRIYKNV
jgi:hypothetical protein